MYPWRRIVPSKDGYTKLPKKCREFLLYVPPDYTTAIWSKGVGNGLLLNAKPMSNASFSPPYTAPAGNIIEVNTIGADGVPTGDSLLGMWR